MDGASRPYSAMSNGLRWTRGALIFLAALFAVMVLFARPLVEFAASTISGREVKIAGAFDIDYSLAPSIHAMKVTVSNPDWSERPNMLSAESLKVQLDLRALLHGSLVLRELRLVSPVLILEKTVQGPVNWQFESGSEKQKPTTGQWSWLPSINHVFVSNGHINYYRSGKNLKVAATVDKLEASATHDQPMSVSASGLFEGVAYRLAASGAPIGTLMDRATGAYPFSLEVSTALMGIHAGGKLGAPVAKNDSDIQASIEGSSLASLLPGESPPPLDQGYKLEGRLQGDGDKWKLSSLHAQSGKTEVQGSMTLDMAGDKPFFRAKLKAPVLNLDVLEDLATAWAGPADKGKDKAGASMSLASAWKRLSSANAQVHLSVDRIIGNGLPLKNLVLDASLIDGKLKVDPVHVVVSDGQFSATLDLNAAAPSHDGKIAMRFDRIPAAPLLELLPYDMKGDGVLDGSLTVAFAAGMIDTADGHIRYEAASGNTSLKLVVDRVQARGQDWLVHLGVKGRLRGEPVNGRLTSEPIALLTGSKAVPVSLDVSLANSRLELEGHAADAGSIFDLKLATSGPGTKKLSRITGVDLPELPGYKIDARLTRKRGLIRIDGLQAKIGQSRFAGSLAMDKLRDPEMLRLNLKAQTLAYADFDQLMSGKGQLPDLTKWLEHTDAEIRFVADRIIGPQKTVFRRVLVEASLQDGHLQIAPLRFTTGGGEVSARAAVNNAVNGQPAGSLHAHVEHVRLSEALKPFGLDRRFPGLLDADIDFTINPGKQKGGNSTLHYRDAAAGTDLSLAVLTYPDQLQVKGQGHFQHEQFRVDGSAGPLSRLVSLQPYPFEADFKALETSGHLAGIFGQPLRLNQLTSTLTIRGPNPRRAEPLVGFRMPELPPYSLTGTLTRRDSVWRFSDFRGEVGNTDLSGWVGVDNSYSKPRVKAVLHSDMLDFDDLGGIIGAAPGDGSGEVNSPRQKEKARQDKKRSTVLPDEEFEFPSFLGFNADVRYSADTVDFDKLPIDSLEMTFQVKDGRVHLAPLVLGAGGGMVRMDMHLVDRPGERPVHGLIEVDITHVGAGKLLHPLDIAEGSAGPISGHGEFRTSGESVAKMMGSLSGKALLEMPYGKLNATLVELAGLDAGEALLLGLEKEQTVDVNCAYIGVTARNGKLAIDTAMVDTTDTKFTMDGAIDLGAERIDLKILAHPKDASLFAARAPLILEGTFKSPDFHPFWPSLFARGAAALVLGAIAPPAALLAFVEPGLGEGGAPCQKSLPH